MLRTVLQNLWQLITKPIHPEDIKYLVDELENGFVSTDSRGFYFGAIDINELASALELDVEASKNVRFRWALNLLKNIKESYNDFKVLTYEY